MLILHNQNTVVSFSTWISTWRRSAIIQQMAALCHWHSAANYVNEGFFSCCSAHFWAVKTWDPSRLVDISQTTALKISLILIRMACITSLNRCFPHINITTRPYFFSAFIAYLVFSFSRVNWVQYCVRNLKASKRTSSSSGIRSISSGHSYLSMFVILIQELNSACDAVLL